MIQQTETYKKAQAERVANLWKHPIYRAKMLEKQKHLGFRQYPIKTGDN